MVLHRSERMRRGTLCVPPDHARDFLDLVGSKMHMQIEDMNKQNMQRSYRKYIQRIDEMERIVRFLLEDLHRTRAGEVVKGNVDAFLRADIYKLDELERQLKEEYDTVVISKDSTMMLIETQNAALEKRCVAQAADSLMSQMSSRSAAARGSGEGDRFEFAASVSLLDTEDPPVGGPRVATMRFGHIAGVIDQVEQDRLARTLFRASRGNIFTHFEPIGEDLEDPKTGKLVQKSVYVIYFQDQQTNQSYQSSQMYKRIRNICALFGDRVYEWPTSKREAEQMIAQLDLDVREQRSAIKAHEDLRKEEASRLLTPQRATGNSLIEDWRLFCIKEKAIYVTLNYFEEAPFNLRATCWYAEEDENKILDLLNAHSGQSHSSATLLQTRIPASLSPPTYIRRTAFTTTIQDLIDTYGVARYQETNPMQVMLVTFPFLFGVMFGDFGHGLIILGIASVMIWKTESVLKFVPPIYVNARYLLFMMGFFACYAGILYNDFFSVGMAWGTSRWFFPVEDSPPGEYTLVPDYDTLNTGGRGPYPVGLDPAWHGAANELIFVNSMKMKISVIFGVIHMTIGLFMRVSNSFHSSNYVNFLFECLPMLVFMLCFFGFMDFMILYKWVNVVDNEPSIINSMICMGMFQYDQYAMFGENWPYRLMIATALSLPLMLIPKPMILWYESRKSVGSGQRGRSYQPCEGDAEEDDGEEKFDLGECLIHQVIETIEYAIGTVSHVASYLRLWALSLAHQQLSVVFFDLTLLSAMQYSFPLNGFVIFLMFFLWLAITLGILLGMDSLESFLHVLRLHWVEYTSKFYKADGYLFEPYRHVEFLVEKPSL